MSLREFFAIRGKPKTERTPGPAAKSAFPPLARPLPPMPLPPAQHPRTEIKRGDYELCLILKTLEATVATLVDLNNSLNSLSAQVQAAVQKMGGSAATAAELDTIKVGIDAATSALQNAVNPPTV